MWFAAETIIIYFNETAFVYDVYDEKIEKRCCQSGHTDVYTITIRSCRVWISASPLGVGGFFWNNFNTIPSVLRENPNNDF